MCFLTQGDCAEGKTFISISVYQFLEKNEGEKDNKEYDFVNTLCRKHLHFFLW